MESPQHAANERPASMLATPAAKYEMPVQLRGEPTVTMIFPHKLAFHLDDYAGYVQFDKGIQEVPESLATKCGVYDGKGNAVGQGMHWYLKQQGVKPYDKPKGPQEPELTAKHVAFLCSQGYDCTTVEGARKLVDSFDPAKRASFFAASDWQPGAPGEEPEVDLSSMTKKDIAAYAAGRYQMALDPGMTKDAMITAVEQRAEAAA